MHVFFLGLARKIVKFLIKTELNEASYSEFVRRFHYLKDLVNTSAFL
jgi:hypothetical protein